MNLAIKSWLALMVAVFQLDLKLVKLLIQRGADVNYRTEKGTLPLTSHPNMKTRMAKLLLQNGADPNAEMSEGRTAMRWAVASATKLQVKAMLEAGGRLELNLEQQEKLLESVRRHNRGVLPLLQELFGAETKEVDVVRAHVKEFPVLCQSADFEAEAARIAEIVNRRPAKWKRRKGVYYFYNVSVVKHLANYFDEPAGDTKNEERAWDLVSRFNAEVLDNGYVLVMNSLGTDKSGFPLLLFPTKDKYAVIAAVGTNGANYGHNTDDIIEWLKEMEEENPFRLVDVGFDFVGGKFTQPIKNAEELSDRMAKFCPEITDFAYSTAEEWTADEVLTATAKSVKTEQAFGFWWD